MPKDVTVIIPARYGSTRFPGKSLANETGRPLVQHVYERALLAVSVRAVIVATDDDRIEQAVRSFGGRCIRTGEHPNGTSRIAEAVTTLTAQPDIVVNVQGDEPEIEPAMIDEAVNALEEHPECPMSTLASSIADDGDAGNPNVVKVAVDQRGHALLFSRAAIPFSRSGEPVQRLKHIGLYAYRTPFLFDYVAMPQTPLELAEHLEQLRVLEHGVPIAVAITHSPTPAGIDTPKQYDAFVARWRQTNR